MVFAFVRRSTFSERPFFVRAFEPAAFGALRLEGRGLRLDGVPLAG